MPVPGRMGKARSVPIMGGLTSTDRMDRHNGSRHPFPAWGFIAGRDGHGTTFAHPTVPLSFHACYSLLHAARRALHVLHGFKQERPPKQKGHGLVHGLSSCSSWLINPLFDV